MGAMDVSPYRVLPETKVELDAWDASDTDGFDGDKADAARQLAEYNDRLYDLQGMLYAEGERKLLVVLQGMDTSGKDGTIKHVFKTVNPLGVRVHNFKRPNDTELAHDYLWRVHEKTPGRGHIAIFNRSHYEDVLVVRVHSLAPEEVWSRRYRHINEFERMLADEGTVIRKFFLHISNDEQRERLQARLDDPKKQWKFEHGDIEERRRWDDYQAAYEDALSLTSTDHAPWYVVPANKKWYRNLVISKTLIDTLEGLDLRYPEPSRDLGSIVIE
jgi:PPK2 family polyphosphate:nucleotide phosphotransferase